MTRSLPIVAILALLAGCSAPRGGSDGAPEYEPGALWGDDDDDDDETYDDDDGGVDGPDVTVLVPEANSDSHHYRDPITVRFDISALGASIGLFTTEGVGVDADVKWSEDWQEVVISPIALLQPDTWYRVEIRLGESHLGFEFSTSLVGLAPDDPAQLDGRAYRFDFSDARGGSLDSGLRSMLAPETGANWVWQVRQLDEPTAESGVLYFDFGVGAGGEVFDSQNMCAAAGRFGDPETNVVRTGSYFRSDSVDMTLTIGGAAYDFEDAWVDGDFSPTGDSLQNVGFSGFLRMDSADAAIGDGEGAACELLGAAGQACVQCPSGEGSCFFVEFDHAAGHWIPAFGLDLVSVDEVELDSECAEAVNDFGCSAAERANPRPLALLLLVGLGARLRRR